MSRHSLWYRRMFCCVLLLMISSSAFAQGTASRVTGTVTDNAGATIPGANVTLTNEATNVSFITQTTDTGTYVFDSVQVGTYSVAVETANFKRFVSSSNPVNINQPATVNVMLEAGNISEVVQVNASAELVQTSSSGNFGNTVEERPLETLPIVGTRGRNPISLINFQPGVVTGANAGQGVHVHGSRDTAFNFTLDGIDINDTSAPGANFSPLRTNPDSITQFQVITGNFSAENGVASGAQVTLVTRSGTNKFHGNLFEFYQTPRFHANDYVNTISGVGRSQFVQNIFGGSIGGPVYLPRFGEGGRKVYNGKDRTFFFVNVQLLRTSQSIFVNRTVYTEAARLGFYRYAVGGFNGNINAARPSVDRNGTPIVPIANFNIANNPNIPLSFDPTTTGLIGLTPLPNNFIVGDGLNTAGFAFVAPQIERQYDFTTKIDHKFNDRNTIYVRYGRGSQNTLGDNINLGLQSFPGLPNVVDTFRSPRNLAANYRATISQSLVNEFVFGVNRFTYSFNNPDPNADINSRVILNLVTDPLNATPTIGGARTLTNYQVVDNLSYIRNAHTFKFGTNLRFQKHFDDRGFLAGTTVNGSALLGTGNNPVPLAYGTRTIPTGTAGINLTDRARLESYINDFLGRVSSITQGFVAIDDSTFGPAGTHLFYTSKYPEYDFYGQDTWKIRQNLTLDYGLRYEVRLSPRSSGNPILRPSFPVRAGETPSSGIRFEEGKLYDDQYKQFAPTVGVAYDPFGTGKTSIRANYRLAYDRTSTFLFTSSIFQNTPGLTRAVNNFTFGSGGGLLRQGLPALSAADLSPQQFRQPPSFSTSALTVVDPDLSYPRTHQYGVSFQREIGWNSVIEVNYIGRQGRKLYGAYDANQVNITGNGFLTAFNTLRDPSTRASVVTDPNFLINRLLAGDSRLQGLTGAQFLLAQSTGGSVRLANGNVATNIVDAGGVATAAVLISQGFRQGTSLQNIAQNGFASTFFQAYPQFTGALNVIENNDHSRYNALEVQFSRRFNRGFAFQASYTLAKSEDTRSFDPLFSVASRGSLQSATSTPFDINNRELNYARSDFDRRHALQGYFTAELPFGRGRRFLSDTNGFVDRLIGGFEFAGILRLYSGRPFTVFSGVSTLSNVVQSPASCHDCAPDMGRIFLRNGINYFFTDEQQAQFFAPPPGEIGNTGRNFFTGPQQFQLDLTLGKRIRFDEARNLELRLEAQNATNTPSFGLPTAVINSPSFGFVGGSVVTTSRRVQLAAKFNF
ncbi:MAG: carboxypeptidase-like regulatory domain-containing protein [Acidobacteriota bacterium]|nr:carboxypeptidase-like regulatory domain-containing protein [Acidobacteriota bacterium]